LLSGRHQTPRDKFGSAFIESRLSPADAVLAMRTAVRLRVWLAAGAANMRRSFDGLARQAQKVLGRDPSRSTSLAECRMCPVIPALLQA
jgi:hypothetical protein